MKFPDQFITAYDLQRDDFMRHKTTRERFKATMSFEKTDRLPLIEWASWWDKTLNRWREEGLPLHLETDQDIMEYFGLDIHKQFWIPTLKGTCPWPEAHGGSILESITAKSYEKLKPHIFPQEGVDWFRDAIKCWAGKQREQGVLIWLMLDGFFWFPRKIMGIENHLFAFYDEPELMHSINRDLLRYNLDMLDAFCQICVPDFMAFAEDMSYNNGPMISEDLFDEFIAPYYREFIKKTNAYGIDIVIDSDGDITKLIPWFEKLGITSFLPLERQSGVDIAALRKNHPNLCMIGGFDKIVMHLGEEAMRKEFERLLPVMKQGGFIPSCDHQTPPQVSFTDYQLYVALLREYCANLD